MYISFTFVMTERTLFENFQCFVYFRRYFIFFSLSKVLNKTKTNHNLFQIIRKQTIFKFWRKTVSTETPNSRHFFKKQPKNQFPLIVVLHVGIQWEAAPNG